MEKMGVILMQKYELGRLLGQGTFAKVYHARRLSTGQSVAIKIIDKEKILKVKLINQIKREISVMRRVRHPNIVELYEVMASRTKIYFVMEYVKGGELFDKVSKGRLGEDEARRYFQQMIGAVDFCHSRGVYHRDIKPENLLLDDNGNLKITDFGLSTLPESRRHDGLLQTTCGTPAYVAPEVINNLKGYDGSKADIWSCGVVLYVLLAGFLPFHDDNLMDMYRKISRGDFKCPNWFPGEARKLLSKILDPCPKSRITLGQVMANSWFGKGFVKGSINNQLENSSRRYDLVHEDHEVSSPTTPRDVRDVFSLYLEESSKTSCTSLDKIGEEDESQESCCTEKMKLTHMNAFDIISMSPGFDLSGLFENNTEELSSSSTSTPRGEATRFATDKTVSAIVSRLEELAESEKFAVRKKGGKVMLQSNTEGRKGLLAIDAEIFEIAPCLHMVEVSKASGDTWEYVKFCESDLRPALKDVTWTWEGGENH